MIHVFIYQFNSDCDNEWLKCFEYNEAVRKAVSLYNIEKPLKVKKAVNGKPYFDRTGAEGSPQVSLSISHSDNLLLLAVSDMNIGIDVERIRKRHNGIINKWFSDKEKQYVLSGENDTEQNERYCEVWTRKEACVKYSGTGIDKNFKKEDVFDDSLKGRIRTFRYGDFVVSLRTSRYGETIRVYTTEGKQIDF